MASGKQQGTAQRRFLTRRVWDAANALSLSRIALAALVWLHPGNALFVLVVVGAAAISDMLDGWLGRKAHAGLAGDQNVGAWLDPVCDKIFVVSAACAVIFAHGMPWVALVMLVSRDVAIFVLAIVFRVVGGRELFHQHDFRARWSGKITTGLQIAALVAVVVWPEAVMALAGAAFITGVWAVIERVMLARRDRDLALSPAHAA